MADLIAGQYPEFNPLQVLTGGLVNATQGNLPAATNARWFGMNYTDSAAGGVTAVANVVAVPVDVGTVVTAATVIVGAAAGTITHCNAQLFSGTATPAALGTQTTDVTSTPFTVNTADTFTWAAPGVLVTPANAPNRFVYFSLGLTDSVAPSFAAASVPVAINVAPSAFGASAPILAARYVGGGATQPATLATPTTVAAATLVWLT